MVIMSEERLDIDKTLAYLTLDEKIRMLSGDGMWHTYGVGELPRIRMSDGPTGLRMTEFSFASAVPATCYPTASMLANSWDPALLYSVGAAIGKEATAMGVNLLLAPGVNIKRHPLGGRNFEYYSEDPYLAGELAKAYISGVQSTGVGACVKHFAANNQETLRMYSDSVIDKRALFELYLKPFEIALQAQPAAVMCAYNKLNGEYCSENKYLLTTVLRDKWNYDGVVISDWGAVHDRTKSLKAGLDLAMPDSHGLFEQNVQAAIDRGEISESTIDRSIKRILQLTDNVYLEPYGDYDTDAHDRLSYNAAVASVVLLKNENDFLPLTKDMRVAVIGELAENAPFQGGGSSQVSALKSVTPLEALSYRAVEYSYYRGYSSDEKQNAKLLAEALDGATGCDAVIVYVGQPMPFEGADRSSLDLPPAQNRLISELTSAGHRVVVMLCSACPVRMPWVNRVKSIIYAGLNGQNGALAAVDALYGRINPRGKLAETFPLDLSEFEVGRSDFGGEIALYRESIFVGYKYYDALDDGKVLFPFGHGLSYSKISYDSMDVKRVNGSDFDVTVTLTNSSVRDCEEIVQAYISDCSGRVLRPKKQLAGYMKVFVEGQTTATATIRLSRRAFEFFDTEDDEFKVPDGEYVIIVAASATDRKLQATVKVDGNYSDHTTYPASYLSPRRTNISDADFETLLGHALPKPKKKPQKGEFTLDCCLDDIKNTFVGKMAKRKLMKRAKSVGAPDSPERNAFIQTAMFAPLSAVYVMSDGAMTLNGAKGIVEMANGNFFKGLMLLLSKK